MEKFAGKIRQRLDAINDWAYVSMLIALIALLGYLDYITGIEFSFSLFYLVPVSLAAWLVGRNFGIYLSVVSTIVWYFSNVLAGLVYTHPLIGYWNALTMAGFLLSVAILISLMKKSVERIRKLAQTEPNTGLLNSHAFYQLAAAELLRTKRYGRPYTVAYLDIDYFKKINDHFGHTVGDMVLKTVANTLRSYLRRTDLVARMGGDEFAILLPETDSEAARVTLCKIQRALFDVMERHEWKVTFSMGAITYTKYAIPVDEMIKRADELMYLVKDAGKNDIRFEII